MSTRPLTKSAVRRHTAQARRDLANLQDRVNAWSDAIAGGRTRPDVTLAGVMAEPGQRRYLRLLLDSAADELLALRALLDVEGVEQ